MIRAAILAMFLTGCTLTYLGGGCSRTAVQLEGGAQMQETCK